MQGVLLDTSAAAPPTVHWAVIALGMVSVIYIAFVRPLKNGKKKDPLARGPSDAALAQQRAVERDMTALLVEYEQVIRTMSAQLETRVAKLDLLIREADERIAALRAAGSATTTGSAAAARSGGLPAAFPSSATPPATSDDSGAGFEIPPEAPALPDEPPRHADVYAWADQGLTYRQIAQKLDRAYGEIELILALRPKNAAAGVTSADDVFVEEPADAAPPPSAERRPADVAAGDRGEPSRRSGNPKPARKTR